MRAPATELRQSVESESIKPRAEELLQRGLEDWLIAAKHEIEEGHERAFGKVGLKKPKKATKPKKK